MRLSLEAGIMATRSSSEILVASQNVRYYFCSCMRSVGSPKKTNRENNTVLLALFIYLNV